MYDGLALKPEAVGAVFKIALREHKSAVARFWHARNTPELPELRTLEDNVCEVTVARNINQAVSLLSLRCGRFWLVPMRWHEQKCRKRRVSLNKGQ